MLVTEKMNDTAKERIRTLVDSQDGFAIAEMDLKLRGPGEFFGTKQSGLPALRSRIFCAIRRFWRRRGGRRGFVEHPPSHEAFVAAIEYIKITGSGGTAWCRWADAGDWGEFRSRRLKSIPGMDVRPTSDKMRETLFNILAPRIEGVVFVDAYAGRARWGSRR
jgi:hypothetical protein